MMSESLYLCDNCGRDGASGSEAVMSLSFADGSAAREAVLCRDCAMKLPGRAVAVAEAKRRHERGERPRGRSGAAERAASREGAIGAAKAALASEGSAGAAATKLNADGVPTIKGSV